MKGEYLGDNQDHHSHSESPNMFANHKQPPQFPHHSFHSSNKEADSPTTTTNIKKDSTVNPSSHDGATIEVIRRHRGRPPGSRNKPKPPVIITRETQPPMSPYVLEISPNVDIIETVTRFCDKRAVGLCILSGSGAVANVTLRQPSSTSPASTVTFHGRFDILSISATLFPNNNVTNNSNNNNYGEPINWPCNFTISLAGPQGQVFGGSVVGPLASAGIIYLIAATFSSTSYQRLPLEEETTNVDVGGGGGGGVNEGGHQSPSGVSGGGSGGGHPPVEGMDMYSLPSDVIWASTARQPQPPPQTQY